MKKEYCPNCRAKMNQHVNWKIGKFICKECYGKEVTLSNDELTEKILRTLEYKYNTV